MARKRAQAWRQARDRRKLGYRELGSFDAEHGDMMKHAESLYCGPVYQYDDSPGMLFKLGFMAGFQYAKRGRVIAPWEVLWVPEEEKRNMKLSERRGA